MPDAHDNQNAAHGALELQVFGVFSVLLPTNEL